MKVKIDILLGFIGSGKTTFINSLLESEQLKNENIVIIQYELGKVNITSSLEYNKTIFLKKEETFKFQFIKEVIQKYSPDRIIIEYNGIYKISEFIKIFNNSELKMLSKIHKIICTIDAKKLDVYLINIGDIIKEQIFNSDIVILNNTKGLNKKEILSLRKIISQINEITKVFECASPDSQKLDLTDGYICIEKQKNFLNVSNIAFLSFILFIFSYLGVRLLISESINITKINFSLIEGFNTIFISILIQAFPFILIGSFISSIIQIFIKKDTIIKFFPKNVFLSCVVAASLGFLFPLCDCGTIPVARGLIKKGIPICVVITFMLCAPIVNPIVIMSTIYAFPNMPSIVIYRVCAGIAVSIIVGIMMNGYSVKDISIFKDVTIDCQCGFCNDERIYNKKFLDKIKITFLHVSDEFFKVGKFMIIGAFLSSIIQILVAQNYMDYILRDPVASLLIMMLLSFVLSVCSTSDAFIAKGFLIQFPMSSIMGFLILGPMIDIKNTIMLFGSFKKDFVLKLIFTVFAVSFTILVTFRL